MATLLFMRNAVLTIKIGAGAAADFQGQVSTAAVEVEAGDTVTYPVLDGTVPSNVGPPTYALHIVAAQDWTATSGLANVLWNNDGATATFWLNAYGVSTASASQPAVTGTVTLVAPTYGGEVQTYAELDVTLPCQAKPTLSTAGAKPTLEEGEEAPAEAPASA